MTMQTSQLVNRLARPEILRMQGYSSARLETGLAPIILNANENPYAPDIGETSWQINRYPPPQPLDVVSQLTSLYQVEKEQLLVTRGSDEGIDLLIRAFCSAGVDSIVYCPPAFGMYAVSAAVQNAVVKPIALTPGDWQLDNQAIIDAEPKLIFLCRPNNPTGHMLAVTDIIDLCHSLADQSIVIVDEAYIEFANEPSMTSELSSLPNLVILRTLSKAWGMAGLRCGAVIADAAIIALLRKIMAPYPLSIATQQMVQAALDLTLQKKAASSIALLCTERERLFAALQTLPVIQHCWASAANFLLVKVTDATHMIDAAATNGILMRNQSAQPKLENCLRISIGKPAENDTLLQFLDQYTEPSNGVQP